MSNRLSRPRLGEAPGGMFGSPVPRVAPLPPDAMLGHRASFEQEGLRAPLPPISGNAIVLSRGFMGQSFAVGTTPVLLVAATYPWSYIVQNPARTVGYTTSATPFSGVANAAGNSQASALGVGGYDSAQVHLDVTAVSGTWDIYAQTYDSASLKWFDSQLVFADVTATGSYFQGIGPYGIGTDLAFRWVPTVAGSITFTLGTILKGASGGTSTGASQIAYLGGPGVTTTSGFPLLEGDKQEFYITEGTELWAVAPSNITVNLFRL